MAPSFQRRLICIETASRYPRASRSLGFAGNAIAENLTLATRDRALLASGVAALAA
jgi:hypothetical protein